VLLRCLPPTGACGLRAPTPPPTTHTTHPHYPRPCRGPTPATAPRRNRTWLRTEFRSEACAGGGYVRTLGKTSSLLFLAIGNTRRHGAGGCPFSLPPETYQPPKRHPQQCWQTPNVPKEPQRQDKCVQSAHGPNTAMCHAMCCRRLSKCILYPRPRARSHRGTRVTRREGAILLSFALERPNADEIGMVRH
jgi:hypothetical protein